MKKYSFIFFLLFCSFLTSCDKSKEVQKAAIDQLHETVLKIVSNRNKISITDGKTVYKDDSLCIIHFVLNDTVSEVFTNRQNMEYIYIVSSGKAYEAIQELKDYSVYVSESNFVQDSQGMPYQSIPYEKALRYKASVFVNGRGRVAGDLSGVREVNIPIELPTKNWEVHNYKDDELFQSSGLKYMSLMCKGYYKTSHIGSYDLTAIITYEDKGIISVKLIEDDSKVVRDLNEYECKITDSKGKVYNLPMKNSYYGKVCFVPKDNVSGNVVVDKIFHNGGLVQFEIQGTEDKASRTYKFTANVDGYSKAKPYVK